MKDSEPILIQNIARSPDVYLDVYCNGFNGIPFEKEFKAWYRKPWLLAAMAIERSLFIKHGIGEYIDFGTIVVGSDPITMLCAAHYAKNTTGGVLFVFDTTEKSFDRSRMSKLLDDEVFCFFLGKNIFNKDVSGSVELKNLFYFSLGHKRVGFVFNNGETSIVIPDNFPTTKGLLRIKGETPNKKIPSAFESCHPQLIKTNYKRSKFPLFYAGLSIIADNIIVCNTTKDMINSSITKMGDTSNANPSVLFLHGAEDPMAHKDYAETLLQNTILLREYFGA